jgi:hypothetical protein
MHTRLCLFLPAHLRRHLNLKHLHKTARNRSHGQVLVLFAVALVVLLVFVGLAVDAGSVYITYGQLKRSVDSAVVAAANDFKRLQPGMTITDRINSMKEASAEVLRLHNIDVRATDLTLYICDADGDGQRDISLQTTAPQFYARCPDTAVYSPRKLVYLQADLQSPLYFLSLVGVDTATLTTNSIAEAAPVDVVIVLDISESMASDTIANLRVTYPGIVDDYDPDATASAGPPARPEGCNRTNTCSPLLDSKEAAKAFIDSLYSGYDQVSIVTFDSMAVTHAIQNNHGLSVSLSDNMNNAKAVVDAITLHDDPPFAKMWPYWRSSLVGSYPLFNPANPEDRDGDGSDFDPSMPSCIEAPSNPQCCTPDADRFDENAKFSYTGWGGVPCDDPYKWDSYDWNGDGQYTEADNTLGASWAAKNARDPDGSGPLSTFVTDSPLSTCQGCGIRMAANILKTSARPGSVWVIIFLSDGIVNMSDTESTMGSELTPYHSGFCNGTLNGGFWRTFCIDFNETPRYCIDDEALTCPPSTTWQGTIPNLNYSVYDYALDMVDEAALTKSTNLNEPSGNDIAIYSIGLGDGVGSGAGVIGENLLRYMAAVGDDGDRTTNPCSLSPHRSDCGQYYYAPSGQELLPIFEDIATRIYTRITE